MALELGAGAGVPELRHILPEQDRSRKTPAKTPADKIMKNYFIFPQTFGIKWEN